MTWPWAKLLARQNCVVWIALSFWSLRAHFVGYSSLSNDLPTASARVFHSSNFETFGFCQLSFDHLSTKSSDVDCQVALFGTSGVFPVAEAMGYVNSHGGWDKNSLSIAHGIPIDEFWVKPSDHVQREHVFCPP